MKPMRFYRDFYSIFFANIVWVDSFGATLPLIIFAWIRSPTELMDISWFNTGVLIVLGIVWFIAFRALYKILYNLKDLRKVTLELTNEGIHYPYLVDSPEVIPWHKIANIAYKEILTDRTKNCFILLTLKRDFPLPVLSSVPDGMKLFKIRDKQQDNILIIVQDVLRGYDLKDIADHLMMRWQRANQTTLEKNHPRSLMYQPNGRPLNMMLVRAYLIIFVFSMLLYGMGIIRLWQEWMFSINSNIFIHSFFSELVLISITVIMGCWLLIQTILPTMLDILRSKIALKWDENGILILDDEEMFDSLTWHKIQDIRLEYTQKTRKSKRKPILIIQSQTNVLGDTIQYVIHRELTNINMHKTWYLLYQQWEVQKGKL